MTFEEKLRLLKAAPADICGYGRLGREVAEDVQGLDRHCDYLAFSLVDCQRLLSSSDDLVRRADLIIHDLLLMCRSRALHIDIPDIDAWIDDSREAINRSIDAPSPVADDWIPWHGGSRPASPETMVLVRFRCGQVETQPFRVDRYKWGHPWDADDQQDTSLDIVAYKVVR